MSDTPAQDDSPQPSKKVIEIRQEIENNLGQAVGMEGGLSGSVTVITPSATFNLPVEAPPSFGGAIPPSRVEDYLPRGDIETQARQRLLRKGVAAIFGVRAPGGLGKTELAIRLATELKAQFEGVLWVEMKDKTPAQVVGDLARQCGLRFPPGIDYQGQRTELRRMLNERPALVVLDNVQPEQAEHLGDFLPPSPPCAALITSRVQNFAALPARAMLKLHPLEEDQALRLLAGVLGEERVGAEREAAQALAKRCCFNPLALDIAARLLEQTKHLANPISVLERKLRERRATLKAGDDPRLDLGAVFDESYQALSEADQRRYRLLAAFHSSGFSPQGAAALWGEELPEANAAIQRLANLSLLTPAAGRGERWRLHDLLDEHAGRHIKDNNEDQEACRTVAMYLVRLFAQHHLDDLSNAPEVGDELDNLRNSIALATREKNGDLLARLATISGNWLMVIFRVLDEWLEWLQTALDLGIRDSRLKALVYLSLGEVMRSQMDMERALVEYAQALALYEVIGDRMGQATVIAMRASVLQFRKDMAGALVEYAKSLALFEAEGDRLGQANVLRARGDVMRFQMYMDGAVMEYNQALALYEAIGSRLGQANVRKARGNVLQFRKDMEGAFEEYTQALTLFKEVGNLLGQANVLLARGDVLRFRKDMDGALEEYAQALAIYDLAGERVGRANVLFAIGNILQFREDYSGAHAYYSQALALFDVVGERSGQANVRRAIGDVLKLRSEYEMASVAYSEAMVLYEMIGDRLGQANVHLGRGDVLRFRSDYDGALAEYAQALDLFKGVGSNIGQANALYGRCQVHLLQNNPAAADELLEQAVAIYRAIGDLYGVANAIGNYGVVLHSLGSKDQARPYLLRAAELFEAIGLLDYAERYHRSTET